MLNLTHNIPPSQQHPVIWPLGLLLWPPVMPHFPCSLCFTLSDVFFVPWLKEMRRVDAGRPIFKPMCLLGKEKMLHNIWNFVAHRVIFTAIRNSWLCHFSISQIKSRDKCTSDCRFCVGKKTFQLRKINLNLGSVSHYLLYSKCR